MSKDSKAFTVHASALSDRGLNERRPLNEDSFLSDPERSIFAVADGVGGAEAGEVASQTAIEVLDEAFRHQTNGADIEDLMELAIQRANSSIHQMAQEHPKFSMMATTIVALHLNGNIATFGHVGDSRLYRLTPDGKLHRETEDHSVVEEEVRAGRMTVEQAANHPSKNVISRALGAEDTVEVDMKTIEVEEGTEFLLCTDGITRHVSDTELRQLLILNDDLKSTCEELKQRCYERGAEDNLTVVIVRAGKRISTADRTEELEPTISPDYEVTKPIHSDGPKPSAPNGSFVPASRIAFPAGDAPSAAAVDSTKPVMIDQPTRKGSGVLRFFIFLFVLGLVGAAFYAGALYRDRVPYLASLTTTQPAPTPTPVPEEAFLKFERSRREVDRNPNGWIATEIPKELLSSGVQTALDSPNPEFLYLYGRASLLTGNHDEATKAFDAAITRAATTPGAEMIKREAALGLAAAHLKTQKDREKVLLQYDEAMKPPATPASSP